MKSKYVFEVISRYTTHSCKSIGLFSDFQRALAYVEAAKKPYLLEEDAVWGYQVILEIWKRPLNNKTDADNMEIVWKKKWTRRWYESLRQVRWYVDKNYQGMK